MTKKLLVIFAVAASMMFSSAFAKTQGNYIGLNALYTNDKSVTTSNDRNSNRDLGAGISYKYALNFNNFFIAPGAFFNSNNSKVEFSDVAGNSYVDKLKYSYGAKLDLGYDVTDKFAVFVTGGYAELSRDVQVNTSPRSLNTYESILYGAGVKYSLDNRVDLNLAYEYMDYNNVLRNDTNVDLIKLGLSFNF